ncbi:MAG: CBS domain-containing protein [Clostridiales bacterium]|nr:CBS domain-containing protein [Clostridiales bacterium]
MKVRELMSDQVVSVNTAESAAVAARLLSRNNVGCLPVCDQEGGLRGMITDRDIVLRCVAASADPNRTPVGAIMTSRVLAVSPDDEAQKASQIMAREQVRRLPVAEQGKVVGMISLADIAETQQYAMEAAACLSEICGNIKKR